MTPRRLLVLAAAALAALGCERTPVPPSATARPLVVASFFTLWDFCRQVTGERAEVVSLVPPGVEPHDWEPTPQDVIQVRKARLFVYNGAGFEQAADRLLKEIAGAGPLPVNTTAGIALLEAQERRAAAPTRATRETRTSGSTPCWRERKVEAITAGLVQVDPEGPRRLHRARRRLQGQARGAPRGLPEAGLRECARRDVVTSHAAFTYLARRYRLEQVPVLGIAPESEPSPADLARLVRFARKAGVKYIFFETLVSPKLAETLAREVGAKTLILNPVEGLTRRRRRQARTTSPSCARTWRISDGARMPLSICFVTCTHLARNLGERRPRGAGAGAARSHRHAAGLERRGRAASTASARWCSARTGTITTRLTPSSPGFARWEAAGVRF